MPSFTPSTALLTIAVILLFAHPVRAFGAGNIASVAKIEGVNWRHGDIEDTLLSLVMSRAAGGKKFDKMSIKRVYFGNWLRDYSQAIDVGTVKYVSAEAIRILLWVLGFMTFGYGTGEFEVTASRLGCYRPEDHIDNPKDYADNIDATQYDRRLRGPVDERVELAIDPRTGLKNYIANEQAGIMTSALHVRKLFKESIRLGRSYANSRDKNELYEALRLLGTGLHCLEDYSAHSNYTELALIELGEYDVFPHVGRRTQIRLQGAQQPVYPLITGTFGGVDFLHSVMGEFNDKATQSEIQDLEGTMQKSSTADTSVLKDILSSIPSGIFGGKDEAGKADELQSNATAAQMSQMRVSPLEPEAFTLQMQQVTRDIYPVIAWHDDVMKQITETIDKIPILPDLIEQLENEVNVFVFSLLAPFVVPLIDQIKTELNEGSSEVIQSSKDKQLIVFHDDESTDPTHSMLSKDHFSNILNEPAGKIASQVLKWVVPQLIECWDDERADEDRTIDRIINGIFHHPAQRRQGEDGAAEGRELMFRVVEDWWSSQDRRAQDELRGKLSRDGVLNGENHLEGVHDTGHGCGKPLGMAKSGLGGSKGSGGTAGGLFGSLAPGLGSGNDPSGIGKFAGEAAGGGVLGGLVGALAGNVGGDLLSNAFGGGGASDEEKPKKEKSKKEKYRKDESKRHSYTSESSEKGGHKQSYTEVERRGDEYSQTQYSETQYSSGRQETDYQSYQQQGNYGTGFEQRSDTRPTYGGGYEQTNERTYRQAGDVETETWREGRTSEGRHYEGSHSESHRERRGSGGNSSDDSGHKKKQKHHKKKKDRSDSGSDSDGKRERRQRQDPAPTSYGGGYGEQPRQEYGEQPSYGGNYGEQPRQEYGEQPSYGGGYGEQPRQEYGAQPSYESSRRGYEEGSGYGSERREYGGGDSYEAPRQEYGGGGGGYGSRGEFANEAGWGQSEGDGEYREERREEYRGERREYGGDRDERSGGW